MVLHDFFSREPFGAFLGMLVFHHKTRKKYFGFIVTLTLILYILVLIVLTGLF
ncbi:MAG: DUF1294 domain-containing protein [Thermoproteota archaeon]